MNSSKNLNALSVTLFWLFNGSLLLILYLGFLPFLSTAVIADAIAGKVPLNFLIPMLGLVGVPTTCTVVGAIPKQKRAISLFQLFYGVEAPILLLCLTRFFWLRDLNSFASALLISGFIGVIAFTHWLISERLAKSDSNLANWWHLAGQTVMLALAVYLVVLATFYLLPLVVLTALYIVPVLMISVIMFPVTVLWIGLWTMPFGMAIAYYQTGLENGKRLAKRHGKWAVGSFITVVLAGWLGLLIALAQQPQHLAFELLKTPPETEQARQASIEKAETIRKGLLNAYLAQYRYPQSSDSRDIFYLYRDSLRISEADAQSLQELYNVLVSPFSYESIGDDATKAANLYAQFFDTPILRGEQTAIAKAIQSTFNRSEAKAGLLDVNQERVLLSQQEITVKPQDDWAEVELYEVYRNQTYEQQEIFYFFSLPESSVLTGVWLGETSDRAKRYVYQVSPRGAAQQVYNEEVSRRVDPALLEQVGPQQYRLRAFPIPPQGQGEMHLWLTYKVLKQDAGWALPELLERRNIYWTSETKRIVNGKTVDNKDRWLPAALPAQNVSPIAHKVVLSDGDRVLAKPFTSSYSLPQGKQFAIILDGSYSMNRHRQAAEQTFQWLEDNILKQNKADLYLTATQPAKPKRLDGLQDFAANKATFYGTLQPKEMLEQFLSLRGETTYDAILFVTDSGSYELTEDSKSVLQIPAPLWVVHLGGLQPAYDDATLQAIQDSGGGVSTSLETVMERLGTQSTLGKTAINLIDGYAWFLEKSNEKISQNEEFSAVAARQWIAYLSRTIKPDEIKELDAIHAIAKQYEIVTPYSSMIVLVNDRQQEALNKAEQQSDRFNREVEDQQLPQPNSPGTISAVPEPSEWLLIIAGVILLGIVYKKAGGRGQEAGGKKY
jgi:putative PEP-CTERM system integral membrane protein